MDEKDVEQLQQQCDEYLEGWKRAKADLINYKKEEDKRSEVLAEYVKADLLLKVMPILDNLERAARETSDKGITQILSQWKEFLKSQGIEEIETTAKPFNPEFHEAVEQVEGEESGIVAEEVEKGYKINNQVLRPAKVKVTK